MSEEKGKIIIIKRNGQDRVSYPLMSNSCLFGSGMYCDIRVQLPSVSERHCAFKVGPKDKVYLSSLSPGNITLLNNAPVSKPVPVHHKDILTVVDRCFRFEYPPDSAHYVPDDSPLSVPEVKSLKIVSPREKPPISNYVKVNGTPGKTQSSAQKKATRKSLDSAKTFIFGDEVSPLSRPNKTYGKKGSPSPRSLTLSAKSKRVSFGPALSPEQFDKTLPPATPVRRGSLPRRQAGTPDYFGSPVIMQYARPKKNRLSAVPREQSIVEETPEEANQSPANSCGVPVSPKSRSPSVTNKQSPKIKGSPMPQQEPSKTSPGITRKSPLSKKSPKSTSPKQKLASPRGKSKPKPNDSEPELLMPLSDSPVSLPSSPKQTAGKSHKNSPVKSQQKTPKDKGSPSKLSPLKVWTSVVSPSSKRASPLSRRKSSLHSTENSSSAASTPNQKNDKKLSSSGKKLPGARALKRLSSGRSPARPVTLTTPSRKSSPKTPKTSSVSKLQYSLSLTKHASLKEGSRRKMLFEEISFSENQNTTDGVGNLISSDPVTDSNSDVKTPKSSPKGQLGHIKLSSKKVSPSPRVLKRLSAGKSPARSLSLTSPTRSIPRKDVKTPTSSSKFRSSLPFVSNSSAKKTSKSKISPTKDLQSSTSEANISQSSVSDETLDSQLTPANRRRSRLHVTPKSSGRQSNSPLKQNPPVNTILTPVLGEEKDYNEVVNTTPVSARRQSQSPMTPKSAKKQVGSSLKATGLVSPTKTSGSKRKSDVAVVSEPTKKNRLSASPSPKLNTPTSSRASPRLQSTPATVEARSAMSPKELLPKASPTTVKTGRNTPATKSPALSLSTNKESSNAEPASALKSKKETPLKMSPKVRSLTSPSKSKAKTPNRTSTGSKFTPSPAKLVTSKPSPKVKSTSTPAKLKQSTPAKKITSAAKSSVKKTASTSKSLKKPGSFTASKVVRSPAKSVKKAFSIKKSSKKPLWTEVVRKGIMNKKVTVKPKVVCSLLSRAMKKKVLTSATKRNLLKKSVPTPHKRVVALMSTGHANSPDTIIIQKRSTSSRASRSRRSLSAVQPQTPGFLVTARTPSTAGKLSLANSSAKSSRTSSAGKRKSLLGKQKSSPNLSSVLTPNISQERFVSPLTTPKFSSRNNSFLEKYVLENQFLMTPGMGETPPIKTTRKSETVDGVKRLQKARTPKADYSNVAGVKRLVQTPRDTPKADYRDVRGIKRIVQTPRDSPKADYRDVRGIKRLVQTPKDSPKADYSNVAGIKNLLKTPASAKRAVSRAKTVSIKQLYLKSSPQSDYTKVTGVKQLFQAVGRVKGKPPARKAKDKELGKEPDFTNVEGVKQLFREPEENEFNISGLQQLFSPVPSMSYDTTPVTQETPPVQAASSPKSRRKQSFNSPVSATNLSNSNKKPVRMTSPVPQKMVIESEQTDGKAILVASSPRSSSRESLKSPVGHLVAEAPDSASKASRPTRSVNAALAPEQPQHAARSPSVRKSGGTVVPSDTPSSKSDKIQKLSTPAKVAVSFLPPVVSEGSPSLNITPKTRQRTPAKGNVDRKSSQSPKRSIGKGVKLNVETSGNEPASTEVPKDVKKGTPVSTPQRTRRGTRPTDVKETPEVIVLNDDSQHDTPVGRRQITRGGRSAGATAKPKAASKKGSKRSANQGTSDSAVDEVQQMVDKEIITTNSPAPSFSSTGKVSPQKISRAPRNKKQPAEEVLEKENVPTDTLPKGGRATRNKKVEGDHRDAAVEAPQKGGRSTRGKKGAIEEIAIDHQASTDLSKKGGRATRGQKVLDQGPAENSSAAPVVSSPRIGKRIKSKGILNKETTDNSRGLSENDVEILEVIEVKGSKRTRGRGTPVQNKSPTASQSIVPQNDEPAAGKGGSRQTRSRNNPSTEVDTSELSHNKDVSRKDRPLRSRDLVNQSPLPSQESVETPTEGRRVNKRGQGNLTSDANGTPGSVKRPRSRRRDQDSVPSTPGDSGATGNKATPEVAATPEKRSGRSKKLLAKADDVVPSTVVTVKDAPNTPVMSKGARNRRNQKMSDTVPQADKEIETSHEVDSVPTVTRRPRRGRQQDSETVLSEAPAQQSRTRKCQTNVSSAETGDITVDSTGVSDSLPRSRRGKTTKTDVPDEKIEVPAAKRPRKQSKKSSVDEGENSLGHADVNEAAPSRRSQSKRNAADSIDDETSPKRAKKGANTSKKSSSTAKKGSKATKVKSTPVKTRSPILEVIPEVDEDAAVTPVAVSRTTRMKASDKQLTKEPAVRRPTRSRRK